MQCSRKYHVKLDRVMTTLDCTSMQRLEIWFTTNLLKLILSFAIWLGISMEYKIMINLRRIQERVWWVVCGDTLCHAKILCWLLKRLRQRLNKTFKHPRNKTWTVWKISSKEMYLIMHCENVNVVQPTRKRLHLVHGLFLHGRWAVQW